MTEKQKVTLNTKAAKNESGNTRPLSSLDNFSSLSSSGLLRKTESVRRTVLSRKAMNLNESENAPSSERRILGGIGGSRGKEFLLLDSGSEAGILRKSQQSSDCCDAQSNETPRAKVAEVAAGKRMLELKNKKDTGIHKKGSPKNDSESGKSMVEMLGVLALMGLLAILGAKGYNMAMERAMANEIINDVNKRSLLHSQQLLAGSALDSSELPMTMQGGYPVSSSPFGDVFFRIDVSEVTPEVCKRLGKMDYRKPLQIKANDKLLTASDQSSCSGAANLLSFFFLKDLTACPDCLDNRKTCVGQSGCAANETCRNNLCVCAPQYSCGATCCSAGQSCINGKCSNAQACDDDSFCDGVCENGACICHSYRDCIHYCTFLWGRTDLGTCSNGDHLGTDSDMGGYIYSTVGLSYYNAIDFCAKYNKQLLTPEELGCQNRADGQGWICNLSNLPKGRFWTKTWFSNDTPYAIDTTSQQIKTDCGWTCNRNALCR